MHHPLATNCMGQLNTYKHTFLAYSTINLMIAKKEDKINATLEYNSPELFSIINHSAVFWRLISLQTHESITQTELPRSYLIFSIPGATHPRPTQTLACFNTMLCLVWTPTKVFAPERSPQGPSKQNFASNWDEVEITAIISVTLLFLKKLLGLGCLLPTGFLSLTSRNSLWTKAVF